MSLDVAVPATRRGEPTWEAALLLPRQGEWTEDDFFALESTDKRLIELDNGCLEVLPMPSLSHQDVVIYLFDVIREHLRSINDRGKVSIAPVPVRLWTGTLREPDLFYLSEQRKRRSRDYPDGADLVMEIVSGSPKDRRRDLVTKRKQYAKAGITEYWIVDPDKKCVVVLSLNRREKQYREHGAFKVGEEATSKLIPGFSVDVTKLFTPSSPS